MCGIAGFWNPKKTNEHPLEILNRMGAALIHRGPDDSGSFFDEQVGLGFAFRRLAILDLSPEGHQPMASASGRYVMVFNGEVHNYRELRTLLEPHSWRGNSDTEVMLEAFERWGVEGAVSRFVGMFAIGLFDRKQRALYLIRDRLGIKPLYYGFCGGTFAFASELKAIRQLDDFRSDIDRDALALYMRHNYVPSPYCIYKSLRKLSPGCILKLDSVSGAPAISEYWSVEEVARKGQEAPLLDSDESAINQLHEMLRESIRLRMISDVPLGAFLSGGVDSSTVVALMQEQNTQPVRTFTIGFHEDGFNEAAHARRVARHLGTDHTELYASSEDALNVIPLLATMYDEPFSDSSQIPTYLVSKLARSHVTVSLSGDGGDELFAGYNRYQWTRKLWRTNQHVPGWIRRSAAFLITAVSAKKLDAAFSVLAPFLPSSLRHKSAGDKAHKLANLLEMDGPQSLYFQSLSHCPDPQNMVRDSCEPGTVRGVVDQAFANLGIEDAMMLADFRYYLPDDILTKVDRASMAVSLEARVPLLDHRVVEFAWRLPRLKKIRNGTSKWILRQVLYKYVPPALIERPKMGFGVPIGRWLRGPLRDWADSLLSSGRLNEEGFFHPKRIEEAWAGHLNGSDALQYHLWDVLMFQSWLDRERAGAQMMVDAPLMCAVKASAS